jgi:hypothetical protein
MFIGVSTLRTNTNPFFFFASQRLCVLCVYELSNILWVAVGVEGEKTDLHRFDVGNKKV